MKTFQTTFSTENLLKSFAQVQKASGWKAATQKYELNLLTNISRLQESLFRGDYQQKSGNSFVLSERGRTRLIRTLEIDDTIVQHTLCNEFLTPVMLPHLIHDNGASLRGKGISFTRRRFEQHLRRFYYEHGTNGYVLKIDFRKFFDNIQHKKLLHHYAKYVQSSEIFNLLRKILHSYEVDVSYCKEPDIEDKLFDSLEHEQIDKILQTGKRMMRKSLGIGSPISQISGISFPNPLDTYCKTVKRLKFYDVYMDDRIILHENKDYLKNLLIEIRQIAKGLGLFINERKTQIIKLSRGFTFLKIRYRLTNSGKIIRRIPPDVVTRQRRKMKKLARMAKEKQISVEKFKEQYQSWRGDKKRYNAYHTLHNMDKLYKELLLWITKT